VCECTLSDDTQIAVNYLIWKAREQDDPCLLVIAKLIADREYYGEFKRHGTNYKAGAPDDELQEAPRLVG
jgi:hypothetical protein